MSNIIEQDGRVLAPADAPKDVLENLFTYHAPTPEQVELYARLRNGALEFARNIHDACPEGPDRSAAIRLLREAVMTANAGIATGGGFYR